jgi:DNA-binding CsgD family transcriptional regulator
LDTVARGTSRKRGTSTGEGSSFAEGEGTPAEQAPAAAAPLAEHAADLERIAPAALAAALEAIPSPTFVFRAPGTVLHANARGRSLLAADRERVLAALADDSAARGTLRFPVDSEPNHALVVLRDLAGDAHSRLPTVTRRWGLTPRQSAVLAQVAQGETNRTVAEKLGCSEKTVELHVSALLAKTRCASRSQLVASFWTDLA